MLEGQVAFYKLLNYPGYFVAIRIYFLKTEIQQTFRK